MPRVNLNDSVVPNDCEICLGNRVRRGRGGTAHRGRNSVAKSVLFIVSRACGARRELREDTDMVFDLNDAEACELLFR